MIPFHTLAERHLVYAYFVVGLFQLGYAGYLAVQWRETGTFTSRDIPIPSTQARG